MNQDRDRDRDCKTIQKRFRIAAMLVATTLAVTNLLQAQSPDAATTPDAVSSDPVTTADPAIPVDHLELLVKPLTKEELAIEADGWRDLLKAKVQQITGLRIAIMVQNEVAKKAQAADERTSAVETLEDDAKSKAFEDRKEELVDDLPELQQQKDQLLQRLNVVLDELQGKGADVESYHLYTASLLGVAVDKTAWWTLIRGWLTSPQGGQRWLWNLAKSLLVLMGFYLAAGFVARMVRRAGSRLPGVSQLLVNFLGMFVKQLVLAIGLLIALTALGIDITPVLAAVGAAGFVVGFALQGTLSNFASGLLILAYRPFDVGDVIDAAGVSGKVDSMSLFSTHIRTFDNKVMIVPNNAVWGGTITNATASDTRRVDMVFGIGYEDDIETAKNVMEKIVGQHELVLKDPAPVVQLNELADSSVNFVCRPWARTSDYWTVYWDITRAVKEEFDRLGISIPFPQRDVHVYQESDS
jgi:small conductance mechanosensitive channel